MKEVVYTGAYYVTEKLNGTPKNSQILQKALLERKNIKGNK